MKKIQLIILLFLLTIHFPKTFAQSTKAKDNTILTPAYALRVRIDSPPKPIDPVRALQSIHYYQNTYGTTVQTPTLYNKPPAGATALCRDGTYCFSQHRSGTCSHHGGVARWL